MANDRKDWARAFPKELLSAPPEERLAWFKTKAVAHDMMNNLRVEIRRLLKGGSLHPIILVVGPTGVGKSTLLMMLKNDITKETLPTLTNDPGRIPIASVDAPAPEMGIFNWRDYYLNCLKQLKDVLIYNKIESDDCELCRSQTKLANPPRASAHSLRHAVEHALVHRRPSSFFIDEAQHLTKMSSGRRLLDQMDIIKSIANCTRIPHVLFGTYDLLALRNLNGQLSRRNSEVHFGRYRVTDKKELAEFKRVLRSFENLLPLKEKPSLEIQWEFMYERSLGCVGTLKEWLTRALELALENNSPALNSKHLESSAMSVARCHTIAGELVHGEERLAEDTKKRPQLLSLLGLTDSVRTGASRTEKTAPENGKQPEQQPPSPLTSSTQKLRPFEQKPKRHSTDPKRRVA